ncbi:amino acid ABC transporter substrate-binding protein [Snodgrassella alvi]|uniref:amino acid ABC transporter substrate-binding protein n=1 Tax=Snodgrassella alvi TaxID=1196083 RepID=UPI000C1F241D|nr:amino acid ABC transporter substrate-binding protein [Snodgrassella alvi]PIT31145.1 amino acid ABC transporter substrate-binding protein [Snodgrassella alvi]PIT35256.1 amino acid ABC transporter substrate-binding protein [Snodgrassella alvi]PXY98701.1 amino acid ABC transporter substrate-binding protein [Snodgrassella alvi]WLT04745.1 amino acid ABC transporter substrate-binding protein [Snodgrassella alvi]
MQNAIRNFLFGSVVAVVLAACGGESASGTASSSGESTGKKVVMGLDDSFPPMGFRNEKNELVGFDIDMAREAAKRAGLNVELKPIDWSAKESELNSKRVDMLWNGLTITPQRQQQLLLSKPYMDNHQIIVVRPDSGINTKADLNGKIVAVQDGSSAVDAVEADQNTAKSFKELKKYADNVTALMDVSAKRVDALVVDEVVGRYYVSKKPNEYKVLGDNFGTEQYAVAFRKDDQALEQKIQGALDSMKADGTSAKIATKWFGKDIIK